MQLVLTEHLQHSLTTISQQHCPMSRRN